MEEELSWEQERLNEIIVLSEENYTTFKYAIEELEKFKEFDEVVGILEEAKEMLKDIKEHSIEIFDIS